MYLNRGGSRILETGGPKSEGEPLIEGVKLPRIDGEARENGGLGLGRGLGELLAIKVLTI